MKVFVCIDDNNGMMFNGRRQSRDSELINKVIEMSEGKTLLMSKYSSRLFKGVDVVADDDYMEIAGADDCCFAEGILLGKYDEKITELVVFKWNRVYPSDIKLDIDLEGKRLKESFDFSGRSHKKITCEVWVR